MKNNHFDYAIIGAGAAGLHLSLAFIRDGSFRDKKILIIEKCDKTSNDRTWCFWEKGEGYWDELLFHSWCVGEFHCHAYSKDLHLDPYRYKMLRSADFYNYAKEKIKKCSNFTWIKEEVLKVEHTENSTSTIQCHSTTFSADHIFDSRIDDDFFSKKNTIRLLQHFKGWFIKTEKPTFNADRFVMMDFRLQWNNQMSFTYVLPFSPTEAMIEFTLFNHSLMDKAEYDKKIKQYVHEYLGIEKFEIEEEEFGVIPMSDFPFHKKNNNTLTKIGTAGGWVKSSSGYAFKNCEKYSEKIVSNLRKGKKTTHQLFKKRYQWYDSIMLDILWNRNEIGTRLFAEMFKNNHVVDIFKFLDDEGTLLSDISIMRSFNPTPFLLTVGKRFARGQV